MGGSTVKSSTLIAVLAVMLAVSLGLNVAQWDTPKKPSVVVQAEGEREDAFSRVVGFMVQIDDGRYFESTDGGYYLYDPQARDILTDTKVQLPIGHRMIDLVALRRWEANEVVSLGYPKGSKGTRVTVNMAGIETLASSKFVAEMLRRCRQSEDGWSTDTCDELLGRWLRNEILYAVGPEELPLAEVQRRVCSHFDFLWNQYGLWGHARKWIWTGVDYQGG